MANETNVHLGCGTVYLQGYINVDYYGHSPIARPDMLEANQTTLAKYYRHPYKFIPFGQNHCRETVVDLQADALELPFKNDSVDSILTVNMINHLRFQDVPKALKAWHRVLKPNGKLIVDVDDVVRMSQAVVEAKTTEQLEVALRYLYCHNRTPFDGHKWGFTAEYLKSIVEPFGFQFAWQNDRYIYHDAGYPQFIECFTKITKA